MVDGPKVSVEVETLEVTGNEMQIAFSGPAVLSNKFFITVGQGGVRIAFAEASGEILQFRTAVVLSAIDAHGLVGVLKDLLDKHVRFEMVEAPAPSEAEDGGE